MKKFTLTKSIDLDIMRPAGFHESVDRSMKEINKNVECGSGWIDVNVCPICGSSSYKSWLLKYGNQIVECNKCTSGFATRRPKNFNDAYNTEEHYNESIKSYNDNRDYRILRFGKERLSLIQEYKKMGNLLDIGCGTGWFIESARSCFQVAGFEPTKNLADFTSKKLGIHVASSLEEFKKSSFDVITAFDVIEHVPDPVDFLKSIHDLLDENGMIVIFTPNKNSAAFCYLKEKENLVTPPIHLHYLNANSFIHLAGQNFKIIYEKTFGLDVGDIYAYERDLGNQEFGSFLYQNSNIIQTFLDYANLGNHLRIILQKVSAKFCY
jgi:SAM-dependent methyltransferase